jgi:hydroxypyruvate isomerase
VRRFCANVSLLFIELPLLERFAAARAAGFECVEMHWHREADPDAVREAVLESSLQVALLNFDGGDTTWRSSPTRPLDRERRSWSRR